MFLQIKPDHVREYGMDIMKRFSSAGFKARIVKGSEFLNEEERATFGIFEDVLFVLEK